MDNTIADSIKPLASQPDAARRLKELKRATDEFESLFINAMLKSMRNTVIESGLFPDNAGKQIYTSMMDEYLAREIAHSGGMGISDMLFKELSKFVASEPQKTR